MNLNKGQRAKSSKKLAIISISIIVFFSIIGIGFANWSNGIGIHTTITTGSMNTCFNYCEVMQEIHPSIEKPADAKVSSVTVAEGGKFLVIVIDKAYPGFSAVIKYNIINNGDIPVYCKLTNTAANFAAINIEGSDGVLYPNGGCREGIVTITVQEVNRTSTYFLSLNLDCEQYNELQ